MTDPATTDPESANPEFDPIGTPFPTLLERWASWFHRFVRRFLDEPGLLAEGALTLVVILVGTGLVLATLHPSELWRNTTPTGGDMGSHVWGPNFLQHELLPRLRLSGWTPDWYNGFPAYQFYMVVPSLMIVALHVGLVWYLAVPVVLFALGSILLAWAKERLYPYRHLIGAVAVLAIVLSVSVPYNRSFKLITAVGLLGIPVACWACAKLADLPFPIPPLASAAGLLFVYNREPLFNNTGNIIGGNFQSTMAGEFAFSISLTVAIVYLGVALRGLRNGKHRALAAALFALAGLCHLIPAFFVLGCTGAMFLIHPDRARLKWLSTMVPVAGLLTAFWVLPFWWRRDLVNDMGWERLPVPNAQYGTEAVRLAGDESTAWYYLLPSGMRWLMVVAVIGIVVSIVRRYSLGIVLAAAWAGVIIGFTFLPQMRLWNARLLPFLYLSVALLAAIGFGELLRIAGAIASGRADRPLRPVTVLGGAVVAIGVLIYVSLPLSGMFDQPVIGTLAPITRRAINVPTGVGTKTETKTQSSLGPFSTTSVNPVAGWSNWNYKGLELKEAQPAGCAEPGSTVKCTTGGWPEYRNLVATMARLGQDRKYGCGRAFWEYDQDRLNGYGTPMAPMMLPYWTDGCIGSQEGLYFESSATVPYHFLMQAELSAKPSSPQREIPYPGFDINAGVRHLQLLGVKYYLASSTLAVDAADAQRDLTEVAVSGPWHVYRVATAPLVAPLAYEPVVAQGMGQSQADWLPVASAWFLDRDRLDVPLATDGPASWKRVTAKPVPTDSRRIVRWTRDQLGITGPMDQLPDQPRTRLPANKVSNIQVGTDVISFDVAKVGVPVLVKASYFPNWEVAGADGPYRVTPNLMVVIPRSTHVSMGYGRTAPDLIGAGLTMLGLVGLVLLARRRPIAMMAYRTGRVSAWLDERVTITRRDPVDRLDLARRRARPPAPGNVRLSVIIPAYFEAERISATIIRVRSELGALLGPEDLQIVVVDDGSTDGTADAARRAGADLVVALTENRGKGAAVRAGMVAATGRTVAFTDADLAYAPAQLARLLTTVEDGWDVVVGNRHHHATTTVVPAKRLREMGGRVINGATRLVLAGRHGDTQCGLKAFRSDIAGVLFGHSRIDGFAFDVELFLLVERYGFSLCEVPVQVENSEQSTVHIARDAAKLLVDLARIRRNSATGIYDLESGALDHLVAPPMPHPTPEPTSTDE